MGCSSTTRVVPNLSHLLLREKLLARPLLKPYLGSETESEPDATRQSRRTRPQEREPWTRFKQSVAITFSPKRQPWLREELDPEVRSEIQRGIEARRSIAAAYADLHTGMRRLVQAASELKPFRDLPRANEQRDTELRKLASYVAADAELPIRDQDALVAMLSRAEVVVKRIKLLAHGCIDVREERSGSIAMKFQLWRQRRNCEPADVEAEAQTVTAFAAEGLEILRTACAKLEAGAGGLKARSC